jgi:hypothetical protein
MAGRSYRGCVPNFTFTVLPFFACSHLLQSPQQGLIGVVFPNPEPDNLVAGDYADGTIPEADADRVNWLNRVHLLELQTRVMRILTEELIRRAGLAPHVLGQCGQAVPEALRCP